MSTSFGTHSGELVVNTSAYKASEVENCLHHLLLAISPQTSAGVLEALSESDNVAILEQCALNPTTPPQTLSKLAQCADSLVRSAVAENFNCPEDTIWLLVFDSDVDVRFSMAENHQLKEDVLEELCLDENPYVACRAMKTLKRLNAENLITGNFGAREGSTKCSLPSVYSRPARAFAV